MSNPTGLVSITLGWVVLDRPDQSGVYIAKDLAAGWAYLIADQDGDSRYRGQGPCAGGVDVALRCAFLSAAACVPEYTSMRILVDTRLAHRAMVRLALQDPRVAAVIGGRQVSVMTRPLERSTLLMQAAAERAASTALRTREREEWDEAHAQADTMTEISNVSAGVESSGGTGWRERQAEARGAPAPARLAQATLPAPAPVGRSQVLQRLVGPLLDGARASLETAGLTVVRPQPRRSRLLGDWLHDFDGRVETARSGLEDVTT
jgi:hypothetical protein